MKTFQTSSQIFLFLAGFLIISAIFLPIWLIDLDAPQYPEGLFLQIYSYKMGGDVNIINGLNHYIGMKAIHEEEFIEFKVLPYIIGFFGVFAIIVAFLKNNKLNLALLIGLAIFGLLSMIDFWLWEYDYGHNLDPNAAIIVPGMAYQPPLIGFKQLLNFGAYSVPDLGGWALVIAGLIIFFVYAKESGLIHKIIKSKKEISATSILILFLTSCQNTGPEPIKINKDNCAFCKMTVAETRFGAEMITDKGRIFKFDDLKCLLQFKKDNSDKIFSKIYVSNYLGNNELIQSEKAFFLTGPEIKSPMEGNIAAFKSEEELNNYQSKLNAQKINWQSLNQ